MEIDNNVPNLANGDTVSETGLNKLALEIMNINDNTETVDVPEPTEVIEPEQVDSIFKHTVESVPLYTMHDDGTFHEVKSFHGVNRKPKNSIGNLPEILHVAPNTTATITMEQIESVASDLISCGYRLTKHGEMKNNKWLFMELEHDDLPNLEFDGTELVPKIWIGSSHDGSLAMKSTVKILDTWCENTFMLNHRSDVLFKTKHTKNADFRIKEYREGLQEATSLIKEYYNSVEKMNDTPFQGNHKLEAYFAHSIGAEKKERKRMLNGKEIMSDPMFSGKHSNQIKQLFESYQYGLGQAERGNTVWSAFSAVTDWCDNHEANEKSREMGTNVIGNRARQKQKAWDFATKLTDVVGQSTTSFIN